MGRTLIRYHNISPEAIAALLGGGASVDPTNLKRDVAQTALMIASICRAGKRDMMGLMVDSFDTLDGIDQNRSIGYSHDSSMDRITNGYLFYDDFNTTSLDLSKWQLSNGTWAIENGQLSGTGTSTTGNLAIANLEISDLILEADVTTFSGGDNTACLMFRYGGGYSLYFAVLRNASASKDPNMVELRKSGSPSIVLASQSLSIPVGSTHHIKVTCIGQSIEVDFDNGAVHLSCTDSSYATGKPGCYVYGSGTHAHYDNFSVVSPQGGMIISVPAQSTNPTLATLFVEDNPGSGTIAYYISRDDGTTWTQVQPGIEADLSSQPPGNALRIKAELTGNAYIDGWALMWR